MQNGHNTKNIFDRIAKRYDLLNHILSIGIDKYWRRKAVKLSNISNKSIVLDLACGSGDFTKAIMKYQPKKIICADISEFMLRKLKKKKGLKSIDAIQTKAEAIPFRVNYFTNIFIAFGVRNFYNINEGLKNCYDILQFKGNLTILEFQLPRRKFIRKIYSLYFFKVLPAIGRIISRDKTAYNYLVESVKKFDNETNLKNLLQNIGFKNIRKYELTQGIVQLITAEK
ncbi:MAG: ubiquinone/menaquinone biosynthesis methyltransferase [Ignavibacteriales bacterium]|nr:ubiquinone/menaquinone biosynthesis methyltransferase [Ignavibacteriales bacterium]